MNRAKFFYVIATLIMLLAVFPIGAVMLWRRRLRWRGYVKLAVMLASICAFFLVASRLVTIPTENRLASQAQRAALEVFDAAQTAVLDAASRVSKNFLAVWDNAPQIAATVYRGVRGGVVYASKSIILSADGAIRGPASVATEPASRAETPEAAAEPAASFLPAASTAAAARTHSAAPGSTVSPAVTPGPTPTPKPTVNPELLPKIKPMGETAVWFTSDGKWYHNSESCGTMRGARRYALNAAIRQKKTRCPFCEPPPPEIISVIDGVWVDDASRVFHITDDCELLGLKWTAEPVADAVAKGYTSCEECGAYHYVHNLAFYNTAPPSKPADKAATDNPNTVVFITEKSVFYHSSASCQALNMMSPSTILDAVNSGLKPCSICGAITYKNY